MSEQLHMSAEAFRAELDGSRDESAIQQALVARCRAASLSGYLDIGGNRIALTDEAAASLGLLFSVPNGGGRSSIAEAAKMKREGALAGVPDLVLPTPDGVVFVELKRRRAA